MTTFSPSDVGAGHEPYDNPEHGETSVGLRRSTGASRQAKKLQLRNAGFRGGTIATRKVTPKSIPSSTWSASGELDGLSGGENVPPSIADVRTPSSGRRVSSGILQDIGNSSITRRKRTTPRMISSRWDDSEGSGGEKDSVPVITQSQGRNTLRQRTIKAKAKLSHQRRSVSAETSKYIEHLEVELAASQSQLSRINSPTVTRQQSTKMRNMDTEKQLLQKEIDDWEAKYEQRVQEVVDSHGDIETSLRGRIRTLEQDVEETRYRMQDLETQLQAASQSMETAEAANVNLERRIEIMSDLLAASPSKIDLHAETPGRARRNSRPKSMLPRFPTASSLLGSPERQAHTQPTSPLLSFAKYSPSMIASPVQSVCRLDISSQQSDYISEAESVFDEGSPAGDGLSSAVNLDLSSNSNPWMLPPTQPSRTKPARRMRRFGAGSFGPKPLILPSTAHCELISSASLPVLGRRQTTPVSFPDHTLSSHDSHSPLLERRRSSTFAHPETLAALDPSPLGNIETERCGDQRLIAINSSSSPSSNLAMRDLSSFGSAAGRNLMEELTTAFTNDSARSSEVAVVSADASETIEAESNAADTFSELAGDTTLLHGTFSHAETLALLESGVAPSSTTVHEFGRCRACSRIIGVPNTCSASIFERLRLRFGALWKTPLDMARYLIRTAQAASRIPCTLLNIQWWLVGALVGPLARRRALQDLMHNSDVSGSPLKSVNSDSMAYGTLYESCSIAKSRRVSDTSGSRKERAVHKVHCPHRRAKHSPLLWVQFSITLAVAIGAACKDGPASMLKTAVCSCQHRDSRERSITEVDPESLI